MLKSRILRFAALLIATMAVIPLLSGCGGRGANAADRMTESEAANAIPIETLTVAAIDFDEAFAAAGVIEPEEDITLSAEIAGRVVSLHKEIGDRVSQRELLVELDDRAQKARLS